MKKLVCLIFSLILILPSGVCFAFPEIKADCAIVALTDGQQIVYSKNPEKKISPSGLTKLFAALTAYDLKDINETIIVDENITEYVSPYEISARLRPGEMLSLYDLLGALVVGSANDAAYQTAITCSGSEEAFVEKMNAKAKALGLKNTRFTNVTGFYDENQYVCASDMLTVYRKIYENEALKKLVNRRSWVIEPTNVSKRRTFWSNNHLINTYYETKYFYSYAASGKISSSSEGGCSAVTTASKGGMNLMCIILNSPLDSGINYSLVDSKNLYEYVFENYTPVTVVKENELMCESKLKNASGASYVLVNAKTQLKGIVKKGDGTDKIEKKLNIPEALSAPLEKGQKVGTASFSYDGNTVGSVNLTVGDDISFNPVKYAFNGVGWFFGLKIVRTVIAVVVLLFIILAASFVYYVNKAQKKRVKRRNRK